MPPPIPRPPRNEFAVASLVAGSLGIFPLPFLGSLAGLIIGLVALIQRYRRGYRIRHDNLIWPGFALNIAIPVLYAWALWYVFGFLHRLAMTLLCAAMLYSSNCPYQ